MIYNVFVDNLLNIIFQLDCQEISQPKNHILLVASFCKPSSAIFVLPGPKNPILIFKGTFTPRSLFVESESEQNGYSWFISCLAWFNFRLHIEIFCTLHIIQ